MQAIHTKFLGPTNNRGSRIAAKCDAKRIVVSWDYALGVAENHAAAAKLLAHTLEWNGAWVGGSLPKPLDNGYAFVWTSTKGSQACAFEVKP